MEERSVETTGSANLWSMLSADDELGYVYLPLTSVSDDHYGVTRPGDGLFGESLVCVEAKTGKRVWHFQMAHHGLWDYDPPAAPNFIDVHVDGKLVKAVAQTSKQGVLYVFDRVTGKPLWSIEKRPVPQSTVPGEQKSPTQPFPTKPAAFAMQGVTEDELVRFEISMENKINRGFEGKVALVTGAGGGIGLATARELAKAGAAVAIADVNADLIQQAGKALEKEGHTVLAVTCDVSDKAQVQAMLQQTVGVFGRLDAAFNNAGVNCDATPMAETDDALFDRLINTNLRGVWNCMKAELPQMLAQGGGAIVTCSSIGGIVGSPGRTAYSASKHGIIGLTMSAANEYAAKRIVMNAVCPGMVDTPMTAHPTHNYDPKIVKRMTSLAPIATLRSTGGDRLCRCLALQSRSGVYVWACGGGRWWLSHAMNLVIQEGD